MMVSVPFVEQTKGRAADMQGVSYPVSNPLFVGQPSRSTTPALAGLPLAGVLAAARQRGIGSKQKLEEICRRSFNASQQSCGCCWPIAGAWLGVLCSLVTAAALAVWHHYTTKIAVMIQQLLAQLQAPGHLSNRVGQTTFIMKIVVVAAVSSVFGSILVLNIVRAYQLNKKRRALTRADWPHGRGVKVFMGFSIVLLMTVWLTGAMLVGLLCLTSILAGAAAAGNIGLGFAVSRLHTHFVTVATTPGLCPVACINLTPVASLLSGGSHVSSVCICDEPSMQELQQDLQKIWANSVTSFTCVGIMLAAASLLALSGIYRYTDAKRDHQEAMLYKQDNNFKQIRESRIKDWVRSSSSGLTGGLFDLQMEQQLQQVLANQQQQTHLMVPEMKGHTSLRKGRSDDDWGIGALHMHDLEQPEILQDQLPTAKALDGSLKDLDVPYSSATININRSRRRWNDDPLLQ